MLIKFFFILIFIIFLFGFFGLLFGFSILRAFFRAIFGNTNKSGSAPSNQQKSKQTNKQKNAAPVGKIITSDEGEYIDFEEIKE